MLALRAWALAVEAGLEEEDWGQPLRVWAVARPDHESHAEPIREELGAGDPCEVLDGRSLDLAVAVVVVVEELAFGTWLPHGVGGRRMGEPLEVRTLLMATRDGDLITITRPRGGQPSVTVNEETGPLIDSMFQALGAPPRLQHLTRTGGRPTSYCHGHMKRPS